MKLFLSLLGTGLAQNCDRPEEKISGFCGKRQDTLNAKAGFDKATERYLDQESQYNKIAKCYNAMVDLDWTITEKTWENNGEGNECLVTYPDLDCVEDGTDAKHRDCCVNSDWNHLSDAVSELSRFGESLDSQADALLDDVTKYTDCLTSRCYL